MSSVNGCHALLLDMASAQSTKHGSQVPECLTVCSYSSRCCTGVHSIASAKECANFAVPAKARANVFPTNTSLPAITTPMIGTKGCQQIVGG